MEKNMNYIKGRKNSKVSNNDLINHLKESKKYPYYKKENDKITKGIIKKGYKPPARKLFDNEKIDEKTKWRLVSSQLNLITPRSTDQSKEKIYNKLKSIFSQMTKDEKKISLNKMTENYIESTDLERSNIILFYIKEFLAESLTTKNLNTLIKKCIR